MTTPASDIPSDPLLARLKSHEYSTTGTAGTLLIFGALITLVCVIVLAIALRIVLPISFYLIYAILMLAMLGLLFFLEKQTTKGFWAMSIEPGDFIGINGFLHREGADPMTTILELLLLGPRLLLAGLHRIQHRPLPRLDDFLARSAVILYTINDQGAGLPLAKLTVDTELPQDLLPHLKFLDHRGWIGFSSDGSKVWLSTPGEKRLRELGIPAAPVK